MQWPISYLAISVRKTSHENKPCHFCGFKKFSEPNGEEFSSLVLFCLSNPPFDHWRYDCSSTLLSFVILHFLTLENKDRVCDGCKSILQWPHSLTPSF